MSKHIRVFKPLLCLSMDQDMHASLNCFMLSRKKEIVLENMLERKTLKFLDDEIWIKM